jgi:hypothetical protein
MDDRLERLRTSLLNSWFPTDVTIFENEDAGGDREDMLSIFFEDLSQRFRIAFPLLGGRVYNDFDSNARLLIQDIAPNILRILGLTTSGGRDLDRLPAITGRSTYARLNANTSESPYMSEQAALDLYTHMTVDEWSGRMDTPLIMCEDAGVDEYILPSMSDFILIYLAEREIDLDHLHSSLYPALESYLIYNISGYVLSALGRYPLSMAMNDNNNTNSGVLDPSDISSITISGKLTLSLSNSSTPDYEKLADLFSKGSGAHYLEQLDYLYEHNKKIFELLKYTRLCGVSVM